MFRERLNIVIEQTGLNRSQFAQKTGIDRSTLTQLLSPNNRRLPRIDTLTEIAETHQVSLDWLLGLTYEGPLQAEMVPESATFESGTLSDNDQRLIDWFEETRGYKVRYVPQSLPDLLKTSNVIKYEIKQFSASSPSQKIETAAVRLAWSKDPGTEMEICSSKQSVTEFARGQGIWDEFPVAERAAALDNMIQLVDELYPTLRWFLFDGRERYAAPVTIFGPIRVALYIGQGYLVLSSSEHVRIMMEHFDAHIRAAVVQPTGVIDYLQQLRAEIA